jgi:hypothetical protein
MLFVKVPTGGGGALITTYSPPDLGDPPVELEISRIGWSGLESRTGRPPNSVISLNLRRSCSLDVVAHIRGRGEVRFADAPWIGRLGPGLWIEALTIRPLDPSIAAAIEYKGLAANGDETPWLPSGTPCGTPGRKLALIGFALRQKTGGSGALFDCEYTGYFASQETAGPVRNGAPCRSLLANDPLEGIQLRITRRQGHPPPP